MATYDVASNFCQAVAAALIAAAGALPASLTSSADVERVLFTDLRLPVPPCAMPGGTAGLAGRAAQYDIQRHTHVRKYMSTQDIFS
jgi:hypothetical protein